MASLPAIANNSDIRFLGKLLGDVIRAYGGERLFEATETIRKASVERHRDASEGKPGDDRAVDLSLEKLSLDETLDFGASMERRFRTLDRNSDDRITKDELPSPNARIKAFDRNKDGVITEVEWS